MLPFLSSVDPMNVHDVQVYWSLCHGGCPTMAFLPSMTGMELDVIGGVPLLFFLYVEW